MDAQTVEVMAVPTVRVSMVHVCFAAKPDVALCGLPLRGVFADGEPVECVVCAEIEAQLEERSL